MQLLYDDHNYLALDNISPYYYHNLFQLLHFIYTYKNLLPALRLCMQIVCLCHIHTAGACALITIKICKWEILPTTFHSSSMEQVSMGLRGLQPPLAVMTMLKNMDCTALPQGEQRDCLFILSLTQTPVVNEITWNINCNSIRYVRYMILFYF